MTTILISRFLLDLQRVKHKEHNIHDVGQGTPTFESLSTTGTVNFASRVIQSLGETLAGDTEVELDSVEGLNTDDL